MIEGAANKPAAGNAGFAPRLTIGRQCPGVLESGRSSCDKPEHPVF